MTLMIIDDSSPSIVYSGQWLSGGIDQEYNHTTHGSFTKGAKATITFTGESIQVYGTIGRDDDNGNPAFAPITMYTMDGQNGSTTTFTGIPGTETLYKQLFYQSPKLSSGQHELVVTLTTSNMNTMWIDFLQVEKSTRTSPGLIAGVIVGGIVGIMLLAVIGILLRRIFRLKRRIQYEKVPRKATQTYWRPWGSRVPGELTPFGSDPLSDTRTLDGAIHPFPVQYSPYSSQSSEPSDSSFRTSLSGYTIRGDTAVDKTGCRESANTSSTSLSGYTTRGGTWADKTISSSTSIPSLSNSSQSNITGHTSYIRYTVQGTTQAEKIDRPSRPSSGTSAAASPCHRPSPSISSDFRLRPSPGTTTNRVMVEGEEALPAYSATDPRNSDVLD